MGNSSTNLGVEYQPSKDYGHSVLGIVNRLAIKSYYRIIKMAEAKALILLFNLIGVPVYVYTLVTNLDNWKGIVLFILGASYGVTNLYFLVIKNRQQTKLRNIEIEEKEIGLMESKKRILNSAAKP